MIKKIQVKKQRQRQRAPSKSSLETQQKILDAAEHLFAFSRYDAASLRDIAKKADVKLGLINHHFGSKEELFFRTVERRAEELARLRLKALADLRASQHTLDLEGVLKSYFYPYLEKAEDSSSGWLAYARLVAIVSAEERWSTVSQACFDPTAKIFITEITKLYPEASKQRIAGVFMFSIASLIALCTSAWRIDAMASDTQTASIGQMKPLLLHYATSGMHSALSAAHDNS